MNPYPLRIWICPGSSKSAKTGWPLVSFLRNTSAKRNRYDFRCNNLQNKEPPQIWKIRNLISILHHFDHIFLAVVTVFRGVNFCGIYLTRKVSFINIESRSKWKVISRFKSDRSNDYKGIYVSNIRESLRKDSIYLVTEISYVITSPKSKILPDLNLNEF